MRIFKATQEFDYPWEQVSAANWLKYPNENSPHVKSVDVLRREYDPVRQVIVSERLIGVSQPVPSWLLAITGGSEKSYVREISTVDLPSRTLTLRSCNLTFGNILKVWETVVYKPDHRDPMRRTMFTQQAEITAHFTFQRVCDRLEDWSVQRFGQNALKGKIGFDSVLKKFDATWQELNLKSSTVLKELSQRSDELLREYKEKTDLALREYKDRTDIVLKEMLREYKERAENGQKAFLEYKHALQKS